ncbi:hypothetical protein OC834_006075 [Tilletia horrida]|nr:hypothetical protein OC834_006075 [Tilletia horrida]
MVESKNGAPPPVQPDSRSESVLGLDVRTAQTPDKGDEAAAGREAGKEKTMTASAQASDSKTTGTNTAGSKATPVAKKAAAARKAPAAKRTAATKKAAVTVPAQASATPAAERGTPKAETPAAAAKTTAEGESAGDGPVVYGPEDDDPDEEPSEERPKSMWGRIGADHFIYLRRIPDTDQEKHKWRCKYCRKVLITPRKTSDLSIHLRGGSKGAKYYPRPCKAFVATGIKLLTKDEDLAERLAPLLDEHIRDTVMAVVGEALADMVDAAVQKAIADVGAKRERDDDDVPARNLRPRKNKAAAGSPEVKIISMRAAEPGSNHLVVETKLCRADGHCGFRAASLAIYGTQERWLGVRVALLEQLRRNKDAYKRELGWTDGAIEQTEKRLEWRRGDERATEDQWFDSTDCAPLLADLVHRPVLIYDTKEGGGTYLVPPSLPTAAPAQSALPPTLLQAMKMPVIGLQYDCNHWDLITKITGRHGLQATPQWAQLQKKEDEGGLRTTWMPRLEQIRAEVEKGLALTPPDAPPAQRASSK